VAQGIPSDDGGADHAPRQTADLVHVSSPIPLTNSDVRTRILVRSVAWVASARWVSQLLRWGATIAMAKLLLPSDYGIVGMAAVVIGLVNGVAEFGLGAAVVQHRELPKGTERRLAGVAVLIAVGFAAVTAASAPLVARFYSEPALLLVLPVLSARFLVDALATLPRAILARNLDFKRLAFAEGVESMVMAATGLAAAYVWRSYWALIAANLVSGAAFALVVNALAPVAPKAPGRIADLKPLLTFGRDLVLSRLAWFSYSNADFVIVGRLLGTGALGAYTLAWNLASAPAEKFAGLVLTVAPAVLSEAKTQAGEVRRMFLVMVQGVALVVLPLAVGLALVGDTLVATVLGPKWLSASAPLQLLALAFVLRSLAALEPVVLMARHETYVDRNMMAALACVTPLFFLAGTWWGSAGVAGAWIAVMLLVSLPMQARFVWRKIGVDWRDWLRAVWPAASSAAFMALVVAGAGALIAPDNGWLRLAMESAMGASAYIGFLWVVHRASAEAVIRVVRRRPAAVSAAAPSVALSADPA
jgi:PST family polysaccharide transporter